MSVSVSVSVSMSVSMSVCVCMCVCVRVLHDCVTAFCGVQSHRVVYVVCEAVAEVDELGGGQQVFCLSLCYEREHPF